MCVFLHQFVRDYFNCNFELISMFTDESKDLVSSLLFSNSEVII